MSDSDGSSRVLHGYDPSAPYEITNSPVIRQSPNTSRVNCRDVDTKHLTPSKTGRSSDQNQSPNTTISEATPMAITRENTIRTYHYRGIPCSSVPCSPTPAPSTTSSPVSVEYMDGTILFQCPTAAVVPCGRSSSANNQRLYSASDELISMSSQVQPIDSISPVHPLGSEQQVQGKRSSNSFGLGLSTAGLCVRDERVKIVKGSHLEMSRAFDPGVSSPPDGAIPSTSSSGLPNSSISGWPYPFITWNSQPQAPPTPEVPPFSVLGKAPLSPPSVSLQLSEAPDVSLPAAASTASRWLEIYQSSQPSSMQDPELGAHGLGLATNIAPDSSHLLPLHVSDMSRVHRRASGSSPKLASSAPHSPISQWPLPPDLTCWKTCNVPTSGSGDGSGFNSSSRSALLLSALLR